MDESKNIPCKMVFTADEFELIKRGYNDSGGYQDAKWRLIWIDEALKMTKANSYNVVYSIRFQQLGNFFVTNWAKLLIGSDADDNYHRQTILYLINQHLLSKNSEFMLNPVFGVNLPLPSHSIHGTAHWQRVAMVGAKLAHSNGADAMVVNLFAYLHDLARTNEYEESEHGQNGAELIRQTFTAEQLGLSNGSYEILLAAIRDHNSADSKSDNLTVQTCWDADRLDLWRVGIIPDPQYLYTDLAKSDEYVNFFRTLSY